MSENKKIVFLDMDGVIVDFNSARNKLDEKTKSLYNEIEDIPGVFSLMDPMPGAIDAIHKLVECYDVYILSAAPWNNPTAHNDKLEWIKKYFGADKNSLFYKRTIFTHNKNLCIGDYLVDDRPHKCGVDKFIGEVIHFGSERFPDWNSVVDYLIPDKI